MPDIERLDPATVHRALTDPKAARHPLLVCAYELHAKCERLRLRGALTLTELQARQATLPPDVHLVFYCS